MQKILLTQAKAGMVLGSDATSTVSTVLAPAGSTVDDAMLRRLALAGVTKLIVQGKPVPGADMGYDAHARGMRLEHLFRARMNDRFMLSLYRLLHRHFKARA